MKKNNNMYIYLHNEIQIKWNKMKWENMYLLSTMKWVYLTSSQTSDFNFKYCRVIYGWDVHLGDVALAFYHDHSLSIRSNKKNFETELY